MGKTVSMKNLIKEKGVCKSGYSVFIRFGGMFRACSFWYRIIRRYQRYLVLH